jgi:DUF1680 family protein
MFDGIGQIHSAVKKNVHRFTAVIFIFLVFNWAAMGEPIKNAVPDEARPLPLSAVRLTGGPLKHAQDLDAKYLLELEPDRMLAGYRVRAGLEPKAEGYGGWDAVNSRQLTGHIAGHYLSAVSLMYAATGDTRFKERADYIVKELKEVQDKHGDGYLGALMGYKPGSLPRGPQGGAGGRGERQVEDGKALFNLLAQGTINSSGFDLNGMWSPWYVLHKTYAGLRDAYRYTGNKEALEVEIKFAEWADRILSKLNDEQIQRMLNTEFGGMNEIFADLYADTGNKKWLDLSYKFEHKSFIEPLKRHQDNLAGKHGNTQVPKLIGSAARYSYSGDGSDLIAASFFTDQVIQHHSFATGGHGKDEYFGEPDKLNDRIDGRTAETCNVYNMIKLARKLHALKPDAYYADFIERALFNHILGSIDPNNGSTCYMVPVGQGVQREYQQMFDDFTCCVGSGMESHAIHAAGIYNESGDKLWVNLYAPSTADWKAAGVTVETETDFPDGESAKIKLTLNTPKELTLAVRKPYWVGEGFSVKVNGEAVTKDANSSTARQEGSGGRRFGRAEGRPEAMKAGSYVDIKRTWKSGDVVEVKLPKTLRLEPLPDNQKRVALMWGPLVLAGDLGAQSERGRGRGFRGTQMKVPVFITGDKPVTEWLRPVSDKNGQFRTDKVGKETDVNFMPFYKLHRRTYGVYWDIFTQSDWDKKSAEYAAEQERLRKLTAATVAYAQPGEMQPERDYNFQGAEDSIVDRVMGRAGRHGRSWFSFDIPVDANHPMVLVVTYNSGPQRRPAMFEILVDGQKVGEHEAVSSSPVRFFDVEYPIPANVVKGKNKVTVRFQSIKENDIATIFGLRMIRGDAER